MDTRPTPPTALDGLDPILFDKYCAGTCLPAELREIEVWVAGHPRRKAALTGVRLGLVSPAYPRMISGVEMDARIGSAIGFGVTAAVERHPVGLEQNIRRGARVMGSLGTQTLRLGISDLRTRSLRRGMWPSLVGVVSGIVAAVVAWYLVPRFSELHSATVSTYATAAGQRATITLSDGSTVVLNVASRLEVPVNYSSGNHTLRLSGEALFTVLHHTGAPFTVVTGKTTTQVLGTSFVVRHYASDTAATVSVREGRVLMQSGVHTVVLPAGRQGELLQNGLARSRPANASQFSFASGVLTLTRVPLSQAIAELDRWYGVDIRLGSPVIGAQEINGTLPAGSVTDLMALLQLTYDVRVARDGPVLTVFPR